MVKRLNPGEDLFFWILNRYKRLKVNENSWLRLMARDFDIDDLEHFLLESTTLMLLRRLIRTAQWYIKIYVDRLIAEDKYNKHYLLGTFGFNYDERRALSKLVFKSIDASRKIIPTALLKQIRDRASILNTKCEISGCDIDYNSVDAHNCFTLDHIWPQSLGGVSEEWNLRVSCKSCNQNRQNMATASDIHYEHFHIRSVWSPDKESSFWNELTWSFRIAALIQANFKCQMCGDSVTNMKGGLDFFTINNDENYNIFNIKVVCGKHRAP